MIKIIITGGGSGGHTMPAVAVVENLKEYFSENNKEADFLYVGSKKGIEKTIASKNGINFHSISTGKLRRYLSVENFFDIFKILMGIFESYALVRKYKPDLIFSTGGFVSVPVVIAGRLCGKKIIVHEQTVDAGLANRISSRFADVIALTFEESKKHFPGSKAIVTGIPLRKKIFTGVRQAALEKNGFTNGLPVLYVSGGGLGCRAINITFKKLLPDLLNRMNVIIQTGNVNDGKDYLELLRIRENIENETLKNRLIVYNFINDEISNIYAMADLAVARSGAGTVNEFIALKIPAIFIPLAIAANDEQYKNAMIMKNMGTAEIIKEAELNPESLNNEINSILFTEKLYSMKDKFKNSESFCGNKRINELIIYLLNSEG